MTAPPVALVVGGGLLGGALARQLAAAGQRVVVASRTERAHPGLWVRWELGRDPVGVLLRAVGAQPTVFVAAGGGGASAVAEVRGATHELASHAGGMIAVAPLGSEGPVGSATVLAVGPLFGPGDRCVAPLLPALREGRGASLPRGIPACRPLYVEDAARAAIRLVGRGGVLRLVGPALVSPDDLALALAGRFGGRVGTGWLARLTAGEVDVCRRSAERDDPWDAEALGERLLVAEWIERLPGPRPRR